MLSSGVWQFEVDRCLFSRSLSLSHTLSLSHSAPYSLDAGFMGGTVSPPELEEAVKVAAAIGRIKAQAMEDSSARRGDTSHTALDADMRTLREVDSTAIEFVTKLVKSFSERDTELKELIQARRMGQIALHLTDLQKFDTALRIARKEVSAS